MAVCHPRDGETPAGHQKAGRFVGQVFRYSRSVQEPIELTEALCRWRLLGIVQDLYQE
jgi:hypothetical protein